MDLNLVEIPVDEERVECHSGYTYAERPIALHWQGERLEIEQVEERWRIPGGLRFRVKVTDGRVFELFYGELYDEWRISLP
jgi:hypothetical protein